MIIRSDNFVFLNFRCFSFRAKKKKDCVAYQKLEPKKEKKKKTITHIKLNNFLVHPKPNKM